MNISCIIFNIISNIIYSKEKSKYYKKMKNKYAFISKVISLSSQN